MYKTVSDISSRYDPAEIVDLPTRVDCYTWCYPLDFGEFNTQEVWKKDPNLLYSPNYTTLYVHVPYCKFVCTMCPFTHSTASEEEIRRYAEAVIQEIQFYSKHHISKSTKVKSVYFGGGTASLLPLEFVEKILFELRSSFNLLPNCQITLECHPKTVDVNYLQGLYSIGINRVSFGLQSFNQRLLDEFKLFQNAEGNVKIIEIAKQIGFNTISADLMYNFPTQNIEDVIRDLTVAIELGIQNLSVYAIDPDVRRLEIQQSEIELEKEMFYKIFDTLGSNGYIQTAQPDYTLPGFENQQIIDLWGAPQTFNIGFGAGAFSESFNGYIWANIHNPQYYIECVENKNIPILMGKKISADEELSRFPALGVRLLEFDINVFNEIFQVDFTGVFKYEIEQLINIGYVEIGSDNIFRVTQKGKFYIDNISKMFFSFSNRGKNQLWGCNLTNVMPNRVYSMDF